MNVFGDNLKALLSRDGLQSNELAIRLDTTDHTIYSYVHGRSFPTFQHLLQLCEIFSCSPNILLAGLYDKDKTEQSHVEELLRLQKSNLTGETARCIHELVDAANNSKMNSFGSRMRMLRAENDFLSISDLAKQCGVQPNTLRSIENDKHLPRFALLISLLNSLCVSPEYLMFDLLSCRAKTYGILNKLTPKQLAVAAVSLNSLRSDSHNRSACKNEA